MLRACCRRFACLHTTRSYVTDKWADLGLHPALLQRLVDIGFTDPTQIQCRGIPPVLRGRSTICHAETGCGKTLCYLLPLLHNLLLEQEQSRDVMTTSRDVMTTPRDKVQYLVFVPTPELGQQIKQMFEHVRPVELGKITPNIWEGLKRGRSHVDTQSPLILTTFSKLKDYDYYKIFGHIPTIVLDEADVYHTSRLKSLTFRILGEFVDPLRYFKVTKQLPKPKQMVYVAATLDTCKKEGGGANLHKWLSFHNVKAVYAKTDQAHVPPATLETFWRYVPDEDFSREILSVVEEMYCQGGEEYLAECSTPEGYSSLNDLGPRQDTIPIHIPEEMQAIERELEYPDKKILIFMNSAESVDILYKTIVNYLKMSPVHSIRNLSRYVYRLSGSLSREERAAVIKRIQRGSIRILVASDVASRGLDIPQLDMVVNGQLPVDTVGYLHRAGRTARMGRYGILLNFLSEHDVTLYNQIDMVTRRKIPRFDDTFKAPPAPRQNSELIKPNSLRSDPWLNDRSSTKFVSNIYRNEFEIQ